MGPYFESFAVDSLDQRLCQWCCVDSQNVAFLQVQAVIDEGMSPTFKTRIRHTENLFLCKMDKNDTRGEDRYSTLLLPRPVAII
jgi:hypothetical protein